MTDEPENHTLRLLQEMRAEMRQGFALVGAKMDQVSAQVEDLTERMETVETTLSGVAGFVAMVHGTQLDQDERIRKLEGTGDTS